MVDCPVQIRLLFIGLFLVLSFTSGCASTSAPAQPKAVTDTTAHTPLSNDEAMYNAALDELNDSMYPEAIAGFNELKTKYPYSKFTALADLRIADAHFKRGKHIEAIDAYRTFLKFHPNHSDAPFALYQIGESYRAQIPEDWWFLPPSAEKDQANTRLAISSYQDMLSRYSDVELSKQAREHMALCQRNIAEHELYVAKFYFKRDQFAAAAVRAEGILKSHAGLGLDAEALWILCQSQIATGDNSAAIAALQRLTSEHPDSNHHNAAEKLLQQLKQ